MTSSSLTGGNYQTVSFFRKAIDRYVFTTVAPVELNLHLVSDHNRAFQDLEANSRQGLPVYASLPTTIVILPWLGLTWLKLG